MPTNKKPLKRNTNRQHKKNHSEKQFHVPYEVKLLLLVAFTIFYLIVMFSNTGAFLGVWLRSLCFGLFGASGYFMPFLLFMFWLLQLNPNLHHIRLRYSFAISFLFIATQLTGSLLHKDLILDIFSKANMFASSYLSGQELATEGVIGNLLSYGLFRIVGSVGVLILTVFLYLIGFYLITAITPTQIKVFVSSRLKANAEKPKTTTPVSPKPEPLRKKNVVLHDFDKIFEKPQEEKVPEALPVIKEPLKEEPQKEEMTVSPEETRQLQGDIEASLSHKVRVYHKPSLALLKQGALPKESKKESNDAIMEKAKRLETVLENFGVRSKVVEITRGPIVNRFEIELEPGTKLSKVSGLSDDIALNLAVSQVRVAPVPGKVAIGIEVPNNENATVVIRDILRSNEFLQNTSVLKFGLGKDISGKSVVVDLAKMPHLLIAGTTGSGKSVCVNTIITSILYNATPDEVKLLMIDPKVVELNTYNGIPHLILPVVTDPKKAAIALGWGVNEMVKRYETFGDNGSKDIDSFNEKYPEQKMPKIVILIDELSDLMMVAPNQVEDAITRIAQMGRAAGIHLIVATQRPSVDVITGLIKANIPSRIAFAVSSGIDSRTILDSVGAEKLLGKGDMLFLPIGANRPRRVQGAFISSEETEAVVEYIKNQDVEVVYNEEVLQKAQANVESDFSDDLLEDAIRVVIDMKSASASMLQRKFHVGYSRAGRLIDMMEERGIIGPSQGSKPREVLVDSYETLEE